MRIMFVAILLTACASSGCTSRPETARREVRVAAAADLKFALEDAVREFEKTHPDIEVKLTFGASGIFFAQLSNQAPFDLFLSADMGFPRKLMDAGLADKSTSFVYAVGHLVLWVPYDSPLDLNKLGMKALLDPAVKKLAIANPRHAPYGRAAEAALKKLGLYDRVQDKLVFGGNIAQAAQFVGSGAADAGLIALSLALAPPYRDKGRYCDVPPDAYPRIEQGGVIMSWAADRDATEALRDFLAGPAGKAVLKRYGFSLPGE
jgi:molybdate transport system substrate-binding protein